MPIITVLNRSEEPPHLLWGKLQEELEKLGTRSIMVEAGAQFQSSAELAALLTGRDLVFADQGVVDSPAFLVLSEKKMMAGEAGREVFHCTKKSDVQPCADVIKSWYAQCRAMTPITGAVLIGGKSSRMGRPKHLIEDQSGTTWLERTLGIIKCVADELVVSGHGAVPDSVENVPRIEDMSDMQGPLAGIGALFSNRPFTSWLVTACDMPYLSQAALGWILEQRHRDYCAVIPKNPKTGRSEPLLAWYDYRCGPIIDELIRSGSRRISDLCSDDRILQPLIPDKLATCWRNINYLEELEPS